MTFFKRPSLLILNIWSIGSHFSFWKLSKGRASQGLSDCREAIDIWWGDISELFLKLQFFEAVSGAVCQYVRSKWDDYRYILLRHVLTQPWWVACCQLKGQEFVSVNLQFSVWLRLYCQTPSQLSAFVGRRAIISLQSAMSWSTFGQWNGAIILTLVPSKN